MNYDDIVIIVFLGIGAIATLAALVSNLVIDIHNKIIIKQARKFFTENPRFCTYKTIYLLFSERTTFYLIEYNKTKTAIDDLIKNRIYISSEKLLEYDENIEKLRKLLEIYSKDIEDNKKGEEEHINKMLDYLRVKFPKLLSNKVEEKMWLYVNIKKEGE